MKFLYPEFLWALVAIAIPIIIHLFSFRRFKKVKFSNVRMIKEVKEETQSKRNLKHLLILLSRILAISALVFAFAQPFIPADHVENIAGQKAISIYVDNSFSMDALNSEGNLLQQSKDKAVAIANSYEQSDLFQILTNDFEGRHQRLFNREEFIEQVNEIEISANTKKIAEVISRQQDILLDSDALGKRAFLISDFQKTAIGSEKVSPDSLIRYNFIPIEANKSPNVYIDSLWFESPVRQLNQNEKLTVRVINDSDENLENLSLNLTINGVQKAISSLDIQAGTAADTSLYFRNSESGIMAGEVSIDDYPIVYDDQFYFSFEVKEKINVLIISEDENANYPLKVFSDDDLFEVKTFLENRIDYAQFDEVDFIIVNKLNSMSSGLIQELNKFCTNGGSLLHLPGLNLDLKSTNEMLLNLGANALSEKTSNSLKVSDILLENPLFSGVFDKIPKNVNLPSVDQFYPIKKRNKSSEQVLLSMQDGSSFLSAYDSGQGKVYSCAAAPDDSFSNFQKHALFVTVLLRMAELSQKQGKLFFTIGKDNFTDEIKAESMGESVIHMIDPLTSYDVIPERGMNGNKTAYFFQNQIQTAANYEVKQNEEKIGSISFNYARDESDLSYYENADLEEKIKASGIQKFQIINKNTKDLSNSIENLSEGTQYWKYFVLLALLMLAIEIILIRIHI
ncbi:MAG: BatA domain-containing protein [Bacteroidota bacterium]